MRWTASAASRGITSSTDPPTAPMASVLKTSRRLTGIPYFLLSPHYRLACFACSSKYSDARHDRAIMVRVGFLSGLLTRQAPSVTNKLGMSCAWQYPLRADVFGSDPM